MERVPKGREESQVFRVQRERLAYQAWMAARVSLACQEQREASGRRALPGRLDLKAFLVCLVRLDQKDQVAPRVTLVNLAFLEPSAHLAKQVNVENRERWDQQGPSVNLVILEHKDPEVQLANRAAGVLKVTLVFLVSQAPQVCPEKREKGETVEKQDQKENREHKVMRETQETKANLEKQESLERKERLATPARLVAEVRRAAEVSPELRDRPARLDLEACRATEVYLESEGHRVPRVKSQAINTSNKFACESCKSSWPSWQPA